MIRAEGGYVSLKHISNMSATWRSIQTFEFNVLIEQPVTFSPRMKNVVALMRKATVNFPALIFTIMSRQLLWLYISTVWLLVLQQPLPECVENLAELRSAVKQACVWNCMTALSSSLTYFRKKKQPHICKVNCREIDEKLLFSLKLHLTPLWPSQL